MVLRLPLRHFLAFPKMWRSHVFREAHKRNFELFDKLWSLKVIWTFFWDLFMALLCSSRWSDQNRYCKTEFVALLTQAFEQDQCELFKPIFLQDTNFLSEGQSLVFFFFFFFFFFLKKIEKIKKFFTTIFHWRTMAMAAMNMVYTGAFSGVGFHLGRCPQGVASVLCKKTPIFGSWHSKLNHLAAISLRLSTAD